MHFLQCVGIDAIHEGFRNQICDFQHFLFLHAAGCDSRRADPDTTRLEDWIGIKWDTVFVHRDAGTIENFLCFFAVNFFWAKIDKHQMIIGTA